MTNETEKSVAEVLKQNTREAHNAVEKSMGAEAIFSKNFTTEQYATLLQRLYRAHHALEPQILKQDEIRNYTGLNSEMRLDKARLAANDIETLGYKTGDEPALEISFNNTAEAWGAYYVLEGSSLGGAVILKQLRKKDHLPEAYSFYGCYGDKTGTLWKDFLNALEETAARKNLKEKDLLEGVRKAYHIFMIS